MSDVSQTAIKSRAKQLLEHDPSQAFPLHGGNCLLHFQNPNFGYLLTTERATFYLNILYGLLLFRRCHELEPLHEDIFQFILPAQQAEAEDGYDSNSFNQDMRQLEKWELISQRIERERLRGYKDTRRRKFRYRISDQALSFLQWLEDQLRDALEPQGPDTRNLLEEAAGGVRELKRTLNKVQKNNPDPDRARTAFYQLTRLGHLTLDINRSLADFNTRLITFTLERYDISTAQALLAELRYFLENYLNRIQLLRREIIPELEALSAPRFAPKWELCKSLLEDELSHSPMLMRSRNIPMAGQEIARLIRFYEFDGQLDRLCARIRASAQSVWRKLYTHLRELERKSHRMEDLRTRIAEMAAQPEDANFSGFINELIAPARMISDMHYWNAAEKAEPPQPRLDQHAVRQSPVNYLKPKAKGSPDSVRSLNEENLLRLRRWIEKAHTQFPAELSQGNFSDFDDHASLIELARNGLLGNKTRLAHIAGLNLEPTDRPTAVDIDDRLLKFNELMVFKAHEEQHNG
jgi:hypothetical protein